MTESGGHYPPFLFARSRISNFFHCYASHHDNYGMKMVSSNSEAIDPSIRLPRNLFQALQSAAQIEKRTVPVQAERIIRQWLVSQGYMSAPTQHQNGAVIVPNSAAP